MISASDLTNQEKLEEVFEMTKENNEILRSLRRQQHIANAFRFLYWIVILVSLGGIYYYIRPMLDTFTKNKENVEESVRQFEQFRSQLPDAKLFNQLLEQWRNGGANAASE